MPQNSPCSQTPANAANPPTDTRPAEFDRESLKTTAELVALAKVSPGTIKNWRQKGMPFIQPANGRVLFHWPSVLAWLMRKQKGGAR